MALQHLFKAQWDDQRDRFRRVLARHRRRGGAAENLSENIAQLNLSPSALEQQAHIDNEVWQRLWALGVFSLTIPHKYGGKNADTLLFVDVVKALSRQSLSLAITAVPHLCNAVGSLRHFATEEMQAAVFSNAINRQRLLSFALTEDHTGSDVASHRTHIKPVGEGMIELNGSKLWTTNAMHADHWVVVAKSPEFSPIPNGSCFVLVTPADQGVQISKTWQKLGGGASHSVSLYFDKVRLPKERLFGIPGKAMQHFSQVVLKGRLGAAAGAIGVTQRALDICCLSDKWVATYHARLLVMQDMVYYAAFLLDQSPLDAGPFIALTKSFVVSGCENLLHDIFSRQIVHHGEENNDLLQLLKDFPVLRVIEGPNEVINNYALLSMSTGLRHCSPPSMFLALHRHATVPQFVTQLQQLMSISLTILSQPGFRHLQPELETLALALQRLACLEAAQYAHIFVAENTARQAGIDWLSSSLSSYLERLHALLEPTPEKISSPNVMKNTEIGLSKRTTGLSTTA